MVALAFGDTTAKRAGRLSLNPIKPHRPGGDAAGPGRADPVGRRCLRLGQAGARSDPTNLRSPRNHACWCRWSGPLTNFVLAAIMGVCFVAVGRPHRLLTGAAPSLLQQIFFYAGLANIVLGVFNLIPCPPLDGAAILERFLPASATSPATTTCSRSSCSCRSSSSWSSTAPGLADRPPAELVAARLASEDSHVAHPHRLWPAMMPPRVRGSVWGASAPGSTMSGPVVTQGSGRGRGVRPAATTTAPVRTERGPDPAVDRPRRPRRGRHGPLGQRHRVGPAAGRRTSGGSPCPSVPASAPMLAFYASFGLLLAGWAGVGAHAYRGRLSVRTVLAGARPCGACRSSSAPRCSAGTSTATSPRANWPPTASTPTSVAPSALGPGDLLSSIASVWRDTASPYGPLFVSVSHAGASVSGTSLVSADPGCSGPSSWWGWS